MGLATATGTHAALCARVTALCGCMRLCAGADSEDGGAGDVYVEAEVLCCALCVCVCVRTVPAGRSAASLLR